MNRFFLLLLLFGLTIASAHAQYVGPVERTLHFRVYGKDAKPITNKEVKSIYSVSEEQILRNATEDDLWYEINTLNINDSTWLLLITVQAGNRWEIYRKLIHTKSM